MWVVLPAIPIAALNPEPLLPMVLAPLLLLRLACGHTLEMGIMQDWAGLECGTCKCTENVTLSTGSGVQF